MCEYCEEGEPMQPRIIDGMDGWPEIYIEGDDLIFVNGNEECIFAINVCPICRRKLRSDAE